LIIDFEICATAAYWGPPLNLSKVLHFRGRATIQLVAVSNLFQEYRTIRQRQLS